MTVNESENMSEFKFSCAYCGQHIQCDAHWSGHETECPICHRMLVVPSLEIAALPMAQAVPPVRDTAASAPQGPHSLAQMVPPSLPARIPLLVRIYGIITMILGILGVVVMALFFVLRPPIGAWGVAIVGVFLLLMFVVVRIGGGLRRGQRQAVYGFCLLALIEVAFRVYLFAATGATLHLCFLAMALGVFYLPPLVSAFRHWAAFA